MRHLALITLLAACGDNAPPDAPRVNILSHDNRPEYASGLAAWADLGFTAGEGGIDCPKFWYEEGVTDCTITIGIDRDPNLRDYYGIDGGADRYARTIVIDSRHSGHNLIHLAAHEIGHIIFDTGKHLKDPAVGIMRSGQTWVTATADDYELACEATGICIQ